MRAQNGRWLLRSLFSLCVLCGLCGESSSAPPTLTYLYPAGAQRGTSVEVTVAGTLDADTKVWASGTGVSVEVVKGKLKVTVAKDAVPGTYWLRAHNADGASALRPFIVGTLPDVAEKEPNDDFKKPQAIESSCVVNGKLEKVSDVDCFAVQLKKGQTLVASLEANHTLRSPMDGMLQILSADGFVLDENNDAHGLDPQIAFTAPKDGTYIARVYALPAQPDSSVRYFGSDACVYRLTITTGAFADFAVPLAVGLDAKEVEADGWNLTAESRKLTIAPGDDSFATAFGANVANTIRVRREPHPTYAKLEEPVAAPFSVTRRIEKPGEEALVAVLGKKGQTVSVQVESRAFGLAVNPVVRVISKDAKPLARAEPAKLNGDTSLAFTFTEDATYTIGISDLYRGAGKRSVFLLRVLLQEPDYELTVAAERFTITPGKPTTIPVKVTRKNGFNKNVEIVAEGLPEGVKLEVTQPAKPDPNTVTLSLSADKPHRGSFRLVGKVKDDAKLTRTARFVPAAESTDAPTADLWLTVTAPAKK